MILRTMLSRLRGEPQLDRLKKDGLEIGEHFHYGKYCFF